MGLRLQLKGQSTCLLSKGFPVRVRGGAFQRYNMTMMTETKDPVGDYRRERLQELGFSKYQIKKLVDMKIDISSIRENYINKGCTPELAWRILRDL